MTPKLDTCQIRGSIVEAFEMEGRVILRVSITGGSIDFVADAEETFHLGDSILLDGDFRLCTARHALEPERRYPVADADFLA